MLEIHGCGTRLYGSEHREELPTYPAAQAEQDGYDPSSYQAIKWFTLFYLPIVPLGTYRARRLKQSFWTTRYPRYQLERIAWDWAQVASHYAIAACVPLTIWLLIKLLERAVAAGY